MINFYTERLNKNLFFELLPLLEASRQEVYGNKDNLTLYNSLDLENNSNNTVNFDYFYERDLSGFLNICTMRDDNKLVGHWTTILNYHAQSKNLLVADTQNIHVLKEYRGVNSKKFMDYTQEVLKKRGVKLLSMAVNPRLNQQSLMEHLGFSLDEVIYSKGL